MDFCYVLKKLLNDGDTADNGKGLHLALSNVNDAEDHENQGSKAAKSGYDTADETYYWNDGKDTAYNADNDFCQEQNHLPEIFRCGTGSSADYRNGYWS